MNRFILVDGLPYLFANNSVHSVRWDKDGFTVGGKVDIAFSPYPLLTEKEVHAKCAVLDSIGAENEESNEETEEPNKETEESNEETEEPNKETEESNEESNKLDEMTLVELKEYASENGIDLNGARKKENIIKAIKTAEGVLQNDNDGE